MGIGVWSLREPAAVIPEVDDTAVDEPVEFAVDVAVDEPVDEPVDAPVEMPAEVIADTAAGMPGLKLGPGRGGILLVCAQDSDSASRLANDISRALGSVPVWAWPDTDAGSEAVKLPDAVEENLFTTVAIFGAELAQRFFPGDLPSSLHAANLVRLPAMQDISAQAEARRALWAALCRSGMVSAT